MSTDDFVTDLTPSVRIPLHTFTTEALAERDRQVAEQAGAQALRDAAAKVGTSSVSGIWLREQAAVITSIRDLASPATGEPPVTEITVEVAPTREFKEGQIIALRADSAAPAAEPWECQHRPKCADAACSHNPAMQRWTAAPARPTTDDREAHEALLREAEWLADPDVAGTVNPAVIRAFAEAAHAALASRPTTPTPTVSEERVEVAARATIAPGPNPWSARFRRDLHDFLDAIGVAVTTDGGEE